MTSSPSPRQWLRQAPGRPQAAAALLESALLLTGCGAMQAAKNLVKAAVYPTVETLKITTQADAVTNADDRGAALPVTVRVYQLSDASQIRQADYAALLDNDQQVLGTGLLKRYEYVSYPQSTSVQEFPIQPDARFIAVLAVMRKPPAPAYFLWSTRSMGDGAISFNIGAQQMRLSAGPEPLNKGHELLGPAPGVTPPATVPPSTPAQPTSLPAPSGDKA